MFFPNWIKSRFKYVSDLFNSNGFKPINEIKDSLISTNNYICEYITLKSVLKKYAAKINLQNITHNRSTKLFFNFHGYFEHVEGKKSNFFYHILLQKKHKKWKIFGPNFFVLMTVNCGVISTKKK